MPYQYYLMNTSATNSLLPVKVGCTVNIDGTPITPVLSLHITQSYGDHHILKLRCYHDQVQATGTFTLEEASRLLGRLTEVVLYNTAATGNTLEAKFVLTDVRMEQSALGEGILCLTGYSPTWLLDGAPHYESFLGKNLSDIASVIAKPLEQLRTTLKAAPTVSGSPGYLSRFGESGWNFLKRLSTATGQWLYFDGRQLVFGAPGKGTAIPLIYGHNCYNLQIGLSAVPVQSAFADYEPEGNNFISTNVQPDQEGAGSYAGIAAKKSKELFSGNAVAPPPAMPASKELLDITGNAAGSGAATGMYKMSGESSLWELTTGALIDVIFRRGTEQHAHTQMRIVNVIHNLDVTGAYHNSFEAVPASASVPPHLSYIPVKTHAVLAEVLSNNDPLGQGRVQVQMKSWAQDHSQQMTDWIRVLTPDAGGTGAVMQNRGQNFIPEVGDQVMVDFLEGNPDRPFVTGSLYHGGNSAAQSNMIRTIMTKSGNKIILNDNAGSITVLDPSGNTWFMDGQGNISVTAPNNISISAGKNISISAGMNITTSAGINISESAGANRKGYVGLMMDTIVGGNHSIKVTGDSTELIEGNFKSESKERKEVAKKGYSIQSSDDSVHIKASKEIQKHSGEKSKNA